MKLGTVHNIRLLVSQLDLKGVRATSEYEPGSPEAKILERLLLMIFSGELVLDADEMTLSHRSGGVKLSLRP